MGGDMGLDAAFISHTQGVIFDARGSLDAPDSPSGGIRAFDWVDDSPKRLMVASVYRD
jgi:hypothetical protein